MNNMSMSTMQGGWSWRCRRKSSSLSEEDKAHFREILYDKAELVKAKFSIDEKVLCFYNNVIYEGKVLDIIVRPYMQQICYLIHFKGWSKRTDEYIQQRYLLKYNDENLEIQKRLDEAREKEKKEEMKNRSNKIKINSTQAQQYQYQAQNNSNSNKLKLDE